MTYKSYLLVLLMAILAFNYVDRLALGIVLQDIKVDLQLTDVQLGLVTGIAFMLFYATMGIPIARWADRGNRVTIISLTTGLWSIACALCGVATSFVQLLVIRIGAAVGEAGCVPPAHSLIADYFTREERPRAVAVYMMGGSVSIIFGYFAAGWLNELYGWRITFVLLAVPSLMLAMLAWLTLQEPRQLKGTTLSAATIAAQAAVSSSSAASFAEVCRTLWLTRAFRHLLLAFSLWGFFGTGILQWQPSFFVRSYGLSTGEIGLWFTMVYGVVGGAGIYLGGEWATRNAACRERKQLIVCALGFCVCAAFNAAVYVMPSHLWAFVTLALGSFGINLAMGPIFATVQTLVPSRMRAQSVALLYLFANLIGAGVGPLVVGALSDGLRPLWGEESLRYALLALSPGYFWAAWHLWRASRTVILEVNTVQVADAYRAQAAESVFAATK